MSSVIELVDVRKTYRRGGEVVVAVNGVTASVEEGDFVGIVGPSGSGKTTLLNLIGCVDTPDRGTVRIDGVPVEGLSERALTNLRARKIGFVFQQFFLLPTLTVEENVLLPALFAGKSEGVVVRASELLERVQLAGRPKHLPSQLSGGEMQRVAIARALINRPRVLLADEPTGNLDSRSAQSIMNLFRDLNSAGLTVLMVTHNADLARQARRTIHLKDGRLDLGENVLALAGVDGGAAG
jgi:putative ABC transport system ATP-binding protein